MACKEGKMERTCLGRTGIEVSRFCIGCMQASGWASSDDTRFVATVRYALDMGLNFLDTAPAYGNGSAEELVSKAIAGRCNCAGFWTKMEYCGHRRVSCPEQMNENLGVMDWRLEPMDWQRLSDISWPLSEELVD